MMATPPSRVAARRSGNVPEAAAIKGTGEGSRSLPLPVGQNRLFFCLKTGRRLFDGCCRVCGRKCERRG